MSRNQCIIQTINRPLRGRWKLYTTLGFNIKSHWTDHWQKKFYIWLVRIYYWKNLMWWNMWRLIICKHSEFHQNGEDLSSMWNLSWSSDGPLDHQNTKLHILFNFKGLFTSQWNSFSSSLLLMLLHCGTTFLMRPPSLRCMHVPLLGPFGESLRHISSTRHTHLSFKFPGCSHGAEPGPSLDFFSFVYWMWLMHLRVCLYDGD